MHSSSSDQLLDEPFLSESHCVVDFILDKLDTKEISEGSLACELKSQVSQVLEQLLKVLLVRVGDSQVVNIQHNHDCWTEQEAGINDALLETLLEQSFTDMFEPESRSNRQAIETLHQLEALAPIALMFRSESARSMDPNWVSQSRLNEGTAEVNGTGVPIQSHR